MQLSGALFYSFAISRSLESASGSQTDLDFEKVGQCNLQNGVKRNSLLPFVLLLWQGLYLMVSYLIHKLKRIKTEFRYKCM